MPRSSRRRARADQPRVTGFEMVLVLLVLAAVVVLGTLLVVDGGRPVPW